MRPRTPLVASNTMLLLLMLSAGQRGLANSQYARSTEPQLNGLLFPGDGNDADIPTSSAAWRKGKLTLGGDYWWRETGDGCPSISTAVGSAAAARIAASSLARPHASAAETILGGSAASSLRTIVPARS